MGVDFDVALEALGTEGRYQTLLYFLLCIPATMPGAFLAFNQVFLSATPHHWCDVPQLLRPFNDSSSTTGTAFQLTPEQRKKLSVPRVPQARLGQSHYAQCEMYDRDYDALWVGLSGGSLDLEAELAQTENATWAIVPCQQGWEFDRTDYDETLVTQFNLVCDNNWWPSTCTTLFYTGSLFGNLLFGWIADKWGRRTSFLLMLFCSIPLSIGTAFAPNYLIYTILRTVNGLAFPAVFQIPFILVMELVGTEFRTFAAIGIATFFALSLALLAGLAYALRHWFSIALATSVPFVFLLGYYWLVPESPRWLLSQNRLADAEKIVQTMARVNKKTIPSDYLQRLNTKENGSSEIQSAATAMDLLRLPNLRRKFSILTFIWLSNAVAYNGLSYNATNLGVSDALAFFANAIVEIPSYFITWWAMDRYGRRWPLALSMLLGGLSCCCCMIVPEEPLWMSVTLAMVGKFGIAASFGIIYLFASELLPTVLRSQAMAIASFVAGLGLLVFPYIVYLAVYSRLLPLLIMGALAMAGGVATVYLPETLGVNLPQTLAEGEAFGRNFEKWTCPVTRRSRKSNNETDDAEERTTSVPMLPSRKMNGDGCASMT